MPEWKARQEQASGITIELWDETRLRELLLRPESADVYRHYYASAPPAAGVAGAAAVHGPLQDKVIRAAEDLAVAVAEQWRREERLRRVQDPDPLPVRWTSADPLRASDHARNISVLPAGVAGPDGTLQEVAETFSRIPSRRLVVVGAGGSGKTVLAMALPSTCWRDVSPGIACRSSSGCTAGTRWSSPCRTGWPRGAPRTTRPSAARPGRRSP